MKNLFYLLLLSVFIACGGGENATEETAVETAIEAVACADGCQKACCLGCKATEGDAKCMVLADGSMPCCAAKTEAAHGTEGHEGHDH